METLKANWINGTAEADQKAKAKALIHLRLTKGDATALAALTGVDSALLQSVAEKAMTGSPASPQEIAVLGQFDAVLSAVLDEAYERADQKYRNGAKLLAVIVAILLSVAGGWIVYFNGGPACQAVGTPPGCLDFWGYFSTKQFFLALLVGASAAPLAPVAKDLASSLQAAVTAVGAARKLAP